MMYNDEKPDGPTSSSKGHTKGVLLFDTSSGYWLVHSVPKFPPPNAYDYPDSGRTYGQSFLCVSFSYKQLKAIGTFKLGIPRRRSNNKPNSNSV